MSLKNVKPLRLTTKLMILYTVATLGILLAICLYLYPTYLQVITIANLGPTSLSAICNQKIIIALLCSSIGAMVLGYFIARSGLQRVTDFSERLDAINSESLHARINQQDWPFELQALSYKFNTMLDRLENSFSQLSQFSSNIAHELRNPIHNLTIATDVALQGDRNNEDYVKILLGQQQELTQLGSLIDKLLFLARADHGKIVLNRASKHLENEIAKIVDYFQAAALDKNIQMQLHGSAIAAIDEVLFARVINNILANAIKFTEAGQIDITVQQHQHNAVIIITDTGVGIPEELLPRILERFCRAHSSLDGLGLGLAIAKSIVELHAGSLNITSQVHHGTTVTITIPT